MCLVGNITPSDWDRIQQGKVTHAVRKAGRVQFLRLLPEAACVIYLEAVSGWRKKKHMIGCDGLTMSRRVKQLEIKDLALQLEKQRSDPQEGSET